MSWFRCGHGNRLFVSILLLIISSGTSAAELSYSQQAFQFPADTDALVIADIDGDGMNDIICVIQQTIRVYFQRDKGFDFEKGYAEITLPGDAVGWDISTGYSGAGQPGSASIIALVDGSEVLVWNAQRHTLLAPRLIKSGLNGFISRGVYRLKFSRDISGNGFQDLIIPAAGVLNLHFNTGSNSYLRAFSVQSESRLRTNLNPTRLERRTGQSIRIPLMELRDVNGDGVDDLISRSEESLDVFLANRAATRNAAISPAADSTPQPLHQHFPASPSYSLDIAEIEARLGLDEFDVNSVDFSNLTGLLALTHEEILEDVDGDGIDDLLLREGGKVSLFGGTADGMDLEHPRQVLRSGGNVLSTFLYDENEDGLKDLWLWRVEQISVGDVFLWLALSGSIAIEAFVYPNDGERFSRRPTRKLSIELKFPSALRLYNTVRDIASEIEDGQSSEVNFSSPATLGGDMISDDLLVLVGNQVQIFLDSIEPVNDPESFLSVVDYSRQRDDYEIDIGEVLESISVNGNLASKRTAGRTADLVIDLVGEIVVGDILPAQLNGDGIDDVFVFTDHNSSHIKGMLLISK